MRRRHFPAKWRAGAADCATAEGAGMQRRNLKPRREPVEEGIPLLDANGRLALQ